MHATQRCQAIDAGDWILAGKNVIDLLPSITATTLPWQPPGQAPFMILELRI
jgi:endogenous inhibitor of DNA gyrase (YacG/DUF329 family)